MKQTGLQNQSQGAQKDFHSCPATADFYAEDHLQVMFVECIPVDPVRYQKQKKKKGEMKQLGSVRGWKAVRPHPLLRHS